MTRTTCHRVLAATTIATVIAATAHAGGYLWMGSEFVTEGTIYRYNIDLGTIDLSISPQVPPGGTHWNNMACDGTHLYIGTPTTQYVGVLDALSGRLLDEHEYTPSIGGHKEDGAYRASTESLWRVTFTNLLHEVTTGGELVQTFTGVGALVGLEWVGETLFATNYSGGSIGTIEFGEGQSASFVPIPWTAGGAPAAGTLGALAYDADEEQLYLMTYNDQRLYSVSVQGGEATAELVAELGNLGMPAGVLVDGMGWAAACGGEPCAEDLSG
ncbi:MAG: hypothetical protein KDA22_15360, partial [Phycisphaerales bacterium]|nr:hypothetical protein [Phycisphaerales bacterium]